MNARSLLSAGTLALVAAIASSSLPAQAAGRCDDARTMIDQRACAQAAQGPDALRRFVERTRAIYALYYYEFARDDTPKPAAVASQQPDKQS
jgi:hypothetical protein